MLDSLNGHGSVTRRHVVSEHRNECSTARSMSTFVDTTRTAVLKAVYFLSFTSSYGAE